MKKRPLTSRAKNSSRVKKTKKKKAPPKALAPTGAALSTLIGTMAAQQKLLQALAAQIQALHADDRRPGARGYLALASGNGHVNVVSTAIAAVSAPLQIEDNPESRAISLMGVPKSVFVLNTAENCAALGIPYDRLRDADDAFAPPPPVKRKRGRPRKYPVAVPTTPDAVAEPSATDREGEAR